MRNTAVLLSLALALGCGKGDSSKSDPAPVPAKPDPAPAPKPDPAPVPKPDPAPKPEPLPPIDCEGFGDHMVELSRGVQLKGLKGAELEAARKDFEVKVKPQRADLVATCKKIGEKDRAHVACVIKAKTPADVGACPPPEP